MSSEDKHRDPPTLSPNTPQPSNSTAHASHSNPSHPFDARDANKQHHQQRAPPPPFDESEEYAQPGPGPGATGQADRGDVRGGGARGSRGSRGRDKRGRGRRGRGGVRHDDQPVAPLSIIKFCCEGPGSSKSEYFERFERGDLNPLQLQPRLRSLGVVLIHEQGAACPQRLEAAHPPTRHDFVPDRRGVSSVHASCAGNVVKSITACLKKMATFIRMQHRANRIIPVRVTCRVNQLNSNKLHWHLHYHRKSFLKLIEATEMNAYAGDIASRAALMKLFEVVDIFKKQYAERGFQIHSRKLKKVAAAVASESASAAVKRNSEDDRVNNVIKVIHESGFKLSSIECRVTTKLGTGGDGKVSLEAEIARTIKLASKLKRLVNASAFQDMRLGLDLESKCAFVEIRPQIFFQMFQRNGGDILSFVEKCCDVNQSRFAQTQKRLIDLYGEQSVKKISGFATDYFDRNPELFAWHETKH